MLEFGVLVFVKGGELENPDQNPRNMAGTKNKIKPHMAHPWDPALGVSLPRALIKFPACRGSFPGVPSRQQTE